MRNNQRLPANLYNQQLKKLTAEQEELAFSPNLLIGPKVIRGVAGSGKTVVLANAVANLLLKEEEERHNSLFNTTTEGQSSRILVLCYNRNLAPYLKTMIEECFEHKKLSSKWRMPGDAKLVVSNIDRFLFSLPARKPFCLLYPARLPPPVQPPIYPVLW